VDAPIEEEQQAPADAGELYDGSARCSLDSTGSALLADSDRDRDDATNTVI